MLAVLSVLLLSSALFVTAGPSPTLSPYIVHESRSHIPAGWSLSRKLEASATLPLRFGLKQSNIEDIGNLLNDVSHPDSPNYGNHWTPGKIATTFAPSTQSLSTVREWLLANGIAAERLRITPTRSWIEVNATVEEAERLLMTEYHVFEHDSGHQHVGQ